jgi:Tfp pilus assembly protein PilF
MIRTLPEVVRPCLSFRRGIPSAWCGTFALIIAFSVSGCAQFHRKDAVQYQTVAADSKHDTKTACEKHAKALVFLENGCKPCDFDKAERLLNEALVADVTYGPAHNSLGMLYFQQSKLYLAAWEFEYAAKLMPEMAEPYNNLGLVYEKAGKYQEALSYYAMALSHNDDNPVVLGNIVRVRMVSGDRSGDLKNMVSDLALSHPNPTWQRWARDQVELTKFQMDKLSPGGMNSGGEELDAFPMPIQDGEQLPEPELQLDMPKSPLPTPNSEESFLDS